MRPADGRARRAARPADERPVVATDRDADPEGPTETDLAAIEREESLIGAEMALLDAEIRALTAPGGPSPLDWRRLRRAEHRVLREMFAFVAAERLHRNRFDVM